MVQVSKKLLVRNEVTVEDTKDLTDSLDLALADYYCAKKEYEKGLQEYKKIIPYLSGHNHNNAIRGFVDNSLKYGGVLYNEQKWAEAINVYREMMKMPGFPACVYKNIGLCMKAIGNADMAIRFLKQFEEVSPDKEDVYVYLADITYSDIKDNFKAIEYYEKALESQPTNFSIYNMLGHLYSTYYQDKFKDKQIWYLQKAYEYAPNNRIVVKNLAYVYGKFHEQQKADEFYAKLMYLNPTHSDLHSYGAYLVQHKRFSEGFKFLQHRFLKEDLGNIKFPEIFLNKKKRWNMKYDISDKHILVHFEQGFGDSIMFVRFLEPLKKLCAKVTLVVQDGLIDLFNDSDLGVEIYKETDLNKIRYDYYIPMMDLPIVCETNPDNIPSPEGYLKVSEDAVKEYGEKYINKNNKFKIGIAFEGTLASKETDRDIPLMYLYPLMQLPNVEVYSFQVDDLTRQMDRVPPHLALNRLGATFRNWKDTAAAMKNMDLMVTTDNGVMNLAGALGIKTCGLFNTITEWRWFKVTGDDIAWYKSIKPYQAPTSKAWDIPVAKIIDEVKVLAEQKVNGKEKSAAKTVKKEKKAAEPKPAKTVKSTKTAKTSKAAKETKTAKATKETKSAKSSAKKVTKTVKSKKTSK